MNESEELKQSIISLIEKMNSSLESNKIIYDTVINPKIKRIHLLFMNHNFSEKEFNRQCKLYSELINRIEDIKEFNNAKLKSINNDNLSLQYLSLINSGFQEMSHYFNTEAAINYIHSHFEIIDTKKIIYPIENELYNFLQQLFSENANLVTEYIQRIAHLKAFELVKDTNNNENVVIIGANGSGKSSFSRNIQQILGKSIVIISAQKIFEYHLSNTITTDDSKINEVRSFQQTEKLCKDAGFANALENDMDSLIGALVSDYTQIATDYLQKRNSKYKTILKKPLLETVISLWHEIIPHRELYYDNKGNIRVRGNDCQDYDFMELSDGEKAVFYYTAHILLANQNSYIIIDEPENHLNFAVVNKMWNILERERRDCVFMYLTHNISFASSRVNARKLWMKSYNQTNYTWNITVLPQDEDLPESLYMEVLGSRTKILFCEGDDNSSLDYKLYSLLFPEYSVKPVKGHYDVIQSVKAFNKSTSIHGNSAIGIIDRDFHSNEEIESWKNDKIYSLPVCEIENIFLDEKIIENAIKQFYPQYSIQEIKDKLFEHLGKNIEYQSTLYARDKAKFLLMGILIKEKKDFAKLSAEINNLPSQINVNSSYNNEKSILENIYSSKNYDELIKHVNDKSLCAELNKLIIADYKEKMIMVIRDNEQLRLYLKNKYFYEIE